MKSATYTVEMMDAIAKKLRDMPPVEKKHQGYSKQEAVRVIAAEIIEMQNRGYTLQQIAEILKGDGFILSTPTLKSYLQRAKPAKPASPVKIAKPAKNKLPKKMEPGTSPAAVPAIEKPALVNKSATTTFTPKPDSDI